MGCSTGGDLVSGEEGVILAHLATSALHVKKWHKRNQMNGRTVRYTPGEIGRVGVIEDFLPKPAELLPRKDDVEVTLALSRRSLDFFKREARKRRVHYQRLIRALVDAYAERQVGGQET